MEFKDIKYKQWLKIYIPEALCAFGDPYCIHVKKGDPHKLIFYFCGGGVSWDKESAKWPTSPETAARNHVGLYTICADPVPSLHSIEMNENSGIHSTGDENPFADWSEVMVPYATGDFHTGTGDLPFTAADGSERILHHHGYLNLQKVLDLIKELFPQIDRLLICGESAGGFAVPALAGDVMDVYPDCEDVTILCDSAIVPYGDWSQTAREVWQCPPHIANPVHSDNIVTDWFTALYEKYGSKPRYLFTCGNRDHVLMLFWHYVVDEQFIMEESYAVEFQKALKKMIDAFKALTPNFTIYIHDFMKEQLSPGVQHCIIGTPSYTQGVIDGVTPVKWLTDAMDGKLYDIGMDLLI
ncbi:MAG: hypothetical protein E7661_04675 [Ruminococcaceae bacterium]|nr:hypothetical protein [Oscillospiraceae bacterium]